MFVRFASVFLVAVVPALVAASAVPRTDPITQCNTGPIQCCNSVQQSNAPSLATLLGLLGLVPSVGSMVGLNCITLVGGNNCGSQPVCCTNNQFNGLVNLGCSPVNVNL